MVAVIRIEFDTPAALGQWLRSSAQTVEYRFRCPMASTLIDEAGTRGIISIVASKPAEGATATEPVPQARHGHA